jgi:hypothetical protein
MQRVKRGAGILHLGVPFDPQNVMFVCRQGNRLERMRPGR